MKIMLSVIVVMLMIGAQSAYALTAYESGFLQGVHDMIHNHFIVLRDRSTEYVNGYNHGLTAAYPATIRQADYQSGYNHGCNDADKSVPNPSVLPIINYSTKTQSFKTVTLINPDYNRKNRNVLYVSRVVLY